MDAEALAGRIRSKLLDRRQLELFLRLARSGIGRMDVRDGFAAAQAGLGPVGFLTLEGPGLADSDSFPTASGPYYDLATPEARRMRVLVASLIPEVADLLEVAEVMTA